jgi:hypothetical protein
LSNPGITLDFSKAQQLQPAQSAPGSTSGVSLDFSKAERLKTELSTNEMLLTSLGGPWANDSRLSDQDKAKIAEGRATGALSVPVVAGAVAGAAPAGTWAAAHPVLTAFGLHVARKLGVPVPKMLDLVSEFGGGQ